MVHHVSWQIKRGIEPELLTLEATELHHVLEGPTVFDLTKDEIQPFFISTLLHGNETSGWDAARRFVTERPDASLLLLIGNVGAAAANVRHMPEEDDFNRVWRQEIWKKRIDELLASANPWCGIDIHNNSGPNPHYSVVTNLNTQTLALAKIFSDKLIYTEHTYDILSHAVSEHCPAVTIEIGTVNDPVSERRTFDFMTQLADLHAIPETGNPELEAYETLAIVRVETDDDSSLENFPDFNDSLPNKSFSLLKEGERFVNRLPEGWRLNVKTAKDCDETDHYFDIRQQQAFLKRDVVLSMFTPNPRLAMQDCVCYFLSQVNLNAG